MQEASEAAGWKCEYRQLDAGRLRSHIVVSEGDDVSFLRESANRRLSVVAESPADTVTVIVPASAACFRINGIDVVDNTVVVVPESTDFLALSDPGADALSLHIPTDRFRDSMSAVTGKLESVSFSGVQEFEVSADTIEGLRSSAVDHANSEVLILDLLRRFKTGSRYRQTLRHARVRQIVARTLEYIDANLGTHLRVTDLCQVADVSVSTLERVFRRELQMTPLAYIKARRLDAIRRSLICGDSDLPISQVAHDHGISHMGRFAAEYRRQFGTLPSEDRPI
jgi:AraC-like DNA-binding protein